MGKGKFSKKKYGNNFGTYKVNEIISELSHSKTSNWGKYLARCSLDDQPETLDIRHLGYNEEDDEYRAGKGIALNDSEADKLTNELVRLGYGDNSLIEKECKRRKEMYGFVDEDEEKISLVLEL